MEREMKMKLTKLLSAVLATFILLGSLGGPGSIANAADEPRTISVDIHRLRYGVIEHDFIMTYEITNVLRAEDFTLEYPEEGRDVTGNEFTYGGKIIAQAPCVITKKGIKQSRLFSDYYSEMYIKKLNMTPDTFHDFADSGYTEANIVTGELIWNYADDEFIEVTDSIALKNEGYYIFAFDDMGSTFLGYIHVVAPGTVLPEDKPSTWAADGIQRASELRLVPGKFRYRYQEPITRAEFCALAVRLYEQITGEEIEVLKEFVDTTDMNVKKMGALNVVKGIGNDKFDPDSRLNREQAAVVLANLANALGKPLEKKATTFGDKDTISSWALEAVGQVQDASIMGGVGNNTFNPSGYYTREQSIITMLRLYDLLTD